MPDAAVNTSNRFWMVQTNQKSLAVRDNYVKNAWNSRFTSRKEGPSGNRLPVHPRRVQRYSDHRVPVPRPALHGRRGCHSHG